MIYVLDNAAHPRLFDVTRHDVKFYDPYLELVPVPAADSPRQQLEQLMMLPIDSGDIICFAGLTPRQHTWNMLDIAQQNKINLMPGRCMDHRGIDIEPGKFFRRRPQEMNQHPGHPQLMLIGDPLAAVESWATILELEPEQIWSQYMPETQDLMHWLSAAAALHAGWQTPDWFPIVDMSIRDLEIAPVMYASNHWTDWIAFYPANGNYKLENHTQLYPVWLDNSEKPLEYWRDE
jgi:hypothetical protein